MKLPFFNVYTIIIAVAFFISSCGSSSKKEEESVEDFDHAEDSIQEQIKEVFYHIPSPSTIPYLLQQTGADFNQNLPNDRKRVNQYLNQHEKASLNLGVYVTDIGYLSSYEKTQEAIDYLGSAKVLAEHLDIIGSFDVDLLKKFESNISNKDSLGVLLDNAVKKSDTFLKDNNQNQLAALMVTGSLIESLSISTRLIKSYPQNLLKDDQRNLILTPLIQIVLKQEKSVDELYKMLGSVEQSESIKSLRTDLEKLKSNYENLNIEEKIKNNRSDLILSDQDLKEITQTVDELRKKIIE